MRLFKCQGCRQTVYFENTHCERCGCRLGYLPEIGLMSALEPEAAPELVQLLDAAGLLEASGLHPLAEEVWLSRLLPGQRCRLCANAEHGVCNWLVPVGADQRKCMACRYNNRVSDPALGNNLARWRQLEQAKHRLFYTLVKLRLPMPTRAENPTSGLAFDFLADPSGQKAPRVLTGHANGLITIALREADDVERERMRKSMGEPYRTLFGDERASYVEALQAYYANGPAQGWQSRYLSAYATMHPWEDFAETWAHYLHMVDTLETAGAHGMEVHPRDGGNPEHAVIDFDPYKTWDFEPMIRNWLPLAAAANSLNRSMGQPDLYPFVLPPVAL